MKKTKFLFVILMFLVIVGCGKKEQNKNNDAKEILDKAITNMLALKSASMNMEATMSMSMFSIAMSGNCDTNFETKIDRSTITAMETTTEEYNIVEDEILYTYSREEGTKSWYYIAKPYIDNPQADFSQESFILFATSYKSVKEVSSDNKEYRKLEVVLSNEAFVAMFEDVEVQNKEDVTAYIYVKDGYIAKIETKFSIKMTEGGVTMEVTLDMAVSYSNYNSIKPINLPKEDLAKAAYFDEEEITVISEYFNDLIVTVSEYIEENPNLKSISFCYGRSTGKKCDIDATVKAEDTIDPQNEAKSYIKYKDTPVFCDSITFDSKKYVIYIKGCSIGEGTVKYDWFSSSNDYPTVNKGTIHTLKNLNLY